MATKINTLDLEITASANNAKKSIDSLAKSLEKLKGTKSFNGNAIAKEIDKATSAADKASSKLHAIKGPKIAISTPQVSSGTIDAVKGISDMEGIGLKVSAAFSNVAKVLAVVHEIAQKVVSALKQVWEVAKNIVSTMARLTKNLIMLSPAGNIIKGLQSIHKSLSGLWKTIVRIAMYRAIRTLIKEITSGFSEGFSNAYKWATITGQKLAPAMDKVATSALYLKNSIGALAGNIAEDFAATISALIDKIAEAISAISKMYSTLTGKGYYYKALKSFKKFGDEVKKSIFGFDELNVLNGDSENYGGMFEKVETDAEDSTDAIKGFTDSIKDWIDNLDLTGAASKMGETINAIVYKLNTFLSSVNWAELGSKIAQGFNSLFESLDPNGLGTLLAQKINMVFGLAKGFVTSFDWGNAGTWLANLIASWFSAINWENVTAAISGAINGLIDFAYNFITNADWVSMAGNLAAKVNEVINNVDWAKAGQTISKWMTTLLESAKEFLGELDWKSIGDAVYQFLSNIDWQKVFDGLLGILEKLASGMLSSLVSFIGNGLKTKVNNLTTTNPTYYSNFDYIDTKADGGTVSTGQLFIANEAGPELVGQVGGKTTVTNQEQFVAGLESANEVVVQAVLAAANAIVGSVNSKDFSVELDGTRVSRQLYSSMQSESTRRGNTLGRMVV